MKDAANFKQLLGMKQENMAMLLQIPLSQWAMYVTGKRDLPLAAKQKLVTMLGFIYQNTNNNTDSVPIENNTKKQIEQYINSQRLTNFNLQNTIQQKLSKTEKKYETATTAVNFINFLEAITENPSQEFKNLWNSIKQNAAIEIENNGVLVQEQFKIKLEVLQFEAALFQKRKKDIENATTTNLV